MTLAKSVMPQDDGYFTIASVSHSNVAFTQQ